MEEPISKRLCCWHLEQCENVQRVHYWIRFYLGPPTGCVQDDEHEFPRIMPRPQDWNQHVGLCNCLMLELMRQVGWQRHSVTGSWCAPRLLHASSSRCHPDVLRLSSLMTSGSGRTARVVMTWEASWQGLQQRPSIG